MYSISVRNKYETLGYEAKDGSVKRDWKNLREAIEEANKKILPKTTRVAKCPWMTEAILLLMDDRRNSVVPYQIRITEKIT